VVVPFDEQVGFGEAVGVPGLVEAACGEGGAEGGGEEGAAS
jgi:hypothetical protein